MISCLTVTGPGRLGQLSEAVRCFEHQTLQDRELVIVHDGDGDYDDQVTESVSHLGDGARVVRTDPGLSLGALRNHSLANARGEVICQWDDDDLYHPERLEVQYAAMADRDAAASMLVDQLHLFSGTTELFWDDWSSEPFPMSLIQGTLMARRSAVGRYPDLPRGEDTPVVRDLATQGHRLAAVQEQGWLYVYVYDGHNAWDESHHRRISAAKARSGPLLEAGLEELVQRLEEYPIAARPVNLVDCGRRIPLTLGSEIR